jgi:hypothetical protein
VVKEGTRDSGRMSKNIGRFRRVPGGLFHIIGGKTGQMLDFSGRIGMLMDMDVMDVSMTERIL